MKEWKQNVMQEVARKLDGIRQMHEGAMEAERQSFQLELERMGGKVEQLESEVKALKFPGQHSTRKTPPAKTVAPSNSDGQKRGKQLEDREGSRESQLIGPRRVNVSPTEASQVDMGTTTNPLSLDTKNPHRSVGGVLKQNSRVSTYTRSAENGEKKGKKLLRNLYKEGIRWQG